MVCAGFEEVLRLLTSCRALLCPGWTKEWHVGIRASASQKLVAFISAIPVSLRVRKKVLAASEVNFMVVHKKLRSKRMAPVLIKEITRRCYLLKIWQAIYTGGVVLPKPVSTCRYFHRSLDWQKLYDVGFSPLPANSKPSYQVRKYALPDHTSTKNLRPMEEKDIDGVLDLLKRYLTKFDIAPVFTRDEVEHWLLWKKDSKAEQVVWSYVVEVSQLFLVCKFVLIKPGPLHQKAHRLLLLLPARKQRNQQRQAQKRTRRLPFLLRHRSRPLPHLHPHLSQSAPQRAHERRPDPREEIQIRCLQCVNVAG